MLNKHESEIDSATNTVKTVIATPSQVAKETKINPIAVVGIGGAQQQVEVGDSKKKKTPEIIRVLSKEEKAQLGKFEKIISDSKTAVIGFFFLLVAAFSAIRKLKLYLNSHSSFEAYFKDKWGFSRAHANRLADAGAFIEEVSPDGDGYKLLTTESHYRTLTSLTMMQKRAVLALLERWAKLSGQAEVSPRMVDSAVKYLYPPTKPKGANPEKSQLLKKILEVLNGVENELPTNTGKEVKLLFKKMHKKVAALNNARRSTGIDWTQATWNPLQGCSPASAGCKHCYAAKLVATRMAGLYPGLASMKGKGKQTTYVFNNVIKLLPEVLGHPLQDLIPKLYFVNSMSDLFHSKVPDEFIEAVFQVMEKAHWHTFQVLTKRPERMAEFTAKFYADRTPPANIWLGTSTEDQKAFDERYPHLLKVKSAVRWLSVEPMIGPIKFTSLDGVDWVVVGGESGSMRKMEKKWATDARDACDKAGVPFFFKQWGTFNEQGVKAAKPKKDGLTPATLDGVVHNDYPLPVTKADDLVRVDTPVTAVVS